MATIIPFRNSEIISWQRQAENEHEEEIKILRHQGRNLVNDKQLQAENVRIKSILEKARAAAIKEFMNIQELLPMVLGMNGDEPALMLTASIVAQINELTLAVVKFCDSQNIEDGISYICTYKNAPDTSNKKLER